MLYKDAEEKDAQNSPFRDLFLMCFINSHNEIYMLPKSQKISRALFKDVFSKKKNIASAFFALSFCKTKQLLPSRFSFVVSKKIAGKATARNILKRRGYTFLQKNKKKIQSSFIVIFFLKKGVEKLSPKDFCVEMIVLLKKIGAWEQTHNGKNNNS